MSTHSTSTTFSPNTPDIWSPTVYGQRYVEQRTRPGLELIQRTVHATTLIHPPHSIRRIVDLGCGTGRFILPLMAAFGGGGEGGVRVVGLDSSAAMLAKADAWVREELRREGHAEWASAVSFTQQSIADYTADAAAPVDLLFTNAALQWLPDHLPLLTHLLAQLPVGGVLANQIPADFDQPSHTLMHDIARLYAQRGRIPSGTLDRLARTSAHSQAGGLRRYYDHLRPLSSHIDCWSTQYLQTISCPVGDHPVAHFLSGSSLNQWLMEMPEAVRDEMRAEYVRRVEESYPTWTSVGNDGSKETTVLLPVRAPLYGRRQEVSGWAGGEGAPEAAARRWSRSSLHSTSHAGTTSLSPSHRCFADAVHSAIIVAMRRGHAMRPPQQASSGQACTQAEDGARPSGVQHDTSLPLRPVVCELGKSRYSRIAGCYCKLRRAAASRNYPVSHAGGHASLLSD